MLAYKAGDDVRLVSPNGRDYTRRRVAAAATARRSLDRVTGHVDNAALIRFD